MANQSNSDPEYERQMAQRRKNNRTALVGICMVLVLIVAIFSKVPNVWIYLLGFYVVIGILLYARSVVEKRYKAAAAALKKAQEEQEK